MAAKGSEIKFHLSPYYKNYFDRIKSKFGEFSHAIVRDIARGVPSLEEFKTFLGRCFEEPKPQLSIAESFDDVMELTIKEKCTVANIDCLETIVNHYNIENARSRITSYESAVDKICEEFKHSVLDVTIVSSSSKYESIMFVLEWQSTDDLTLNDIYGLLWRAFRNMANRVSFNCRLKRDTGTVDWRHDDNSVLVISPSIEQCENIVSRLKQEKEINKKSLWRIELRSSATESARVLIDNLDQFAVRELSIEDTSLDSIYISTLAKKFTKVKKLLFNSSSLPNNSIKQVSNALEHTDTSLEGLFLWNVPITVDDVNCLSDVISNNKTLKILDLSNCDITDEGVQYICEGVAKNQTLTMLALSNNLQITSASTSAIVELIKTTKSLEILYLRNTSLNDDDIETISTALTERTTIKQLVLSKQHEKICWTFNPTTKDKLYFVMEKPSEFEIVTTSTSGHHDLHNAKQEKDQHIAQLTHKLQSVTREKVESQEIIITLQTKLQQYKQQLLKTTDIYSYLPKLAIILEPVQEDWEQLGHQLNIDQSVLTDMRNKRDSTEQMKYLLEEWALKGGTLAQLEDSLLHLDKKEVISDLHALQGKESIVIDTSEQISTKSNDKSNSQQTVKTMDVSTDVTETSINNNEKELLSKLKEKDQEIEILKERVTSLTPEDKIIQQESFQVTRNNVTVQTESMELSVDKQDVSVQFNYLILSDDTLKGVCIGGEEMFLIQGDSAQFFNWEQYGLRMTILEGTLSPADTCEVAVRALVGGQFQLPEDTELISVVYSISVSKPLLKPVKLDIQHCVDLVTQDHISYLRFATASVNTGLPYQFKFEEGGQFHTGDQYGSIYLSRFSLWTIVKFFKRLLGYPTSSESSSDDELSSVEPIQEDGNEDSPAEGDTQSVEWRHDDNSVLAISPSTEQCENIVSRLKREKEIREKSLWRIELRLSTAESALVLIDNLDQIAVRELSIEDTSLDEKCISTLAKTFTKVKKLLFNSSSLPIGSIKHVVDALAHTNTSLEGLFLWNVPTTVDDVICLSKVISINKTVKVLDLSNCDITDKGVQYICEGVAKNQTLTMLAVSNNLQITSACTSAIVELIKTTTSLEILYLRNTSLNDDDIKIISNTLTETTTIQQLVLSEQHEKICKTFNPSIKDKLYFVVNETVTASTSGYYDSHNTKQEKDRYIAQLTRKLQSITREKEEIITTLQTKLREYKQQLLKTTDISSYLPTLAVILQPVQEDWEQLGLQLNIDQSVLTDIRNKRDSTEQMKYLLEEWALKRGTLTQLEEALLYLDKKEVIPDLHALQEKESIVIDTSEQISTKFNDKPNSQHTIKTMDVSTDVTETSNNMSSSIGAIDRTKSLTPSLSTDDKSSSIDISASSLEYSPPFPHSSTLPSEQFKTKDVSHGSNIPPHNKYVAQTVYEVKCDGTKWLMHFVVAKHLNALLEYIKKSLPSNIEKDVLLSFTFENDDGYIELILNEKQERPFNGWDIDPHLEPMVLYKHDVDMFGSNDPPSCPSILITVSAGYVPDTVDKIKYSIPLKGIKPDNMKINIIRSIGNGCTLDLVPDRHVLLKLLAGIEQMWYEIGVALKIPDEELKGLQEKSLPDTNKLSKVLQYWISQCVEVTWYSIITAVRSKIVGQTQISQEIESYVLQLQAGVQIAAPSKDPALSDDKVNEVIKILQDVLTKYQSALDGLLKASIKSFAVDMYSHGLISKSTKDTTNFDDMMREFNSGMDFIRDSHKLVKHCQLFLQSLVKQGGPHKQAASRIAEEWTANIKEKLNINIEFDIE